VTVSESESFGDWFRRNRARNEWIQRVRAEAGGDADHCIDEFIDFGDDLEALRYRLWARCWEASRGPEGARTPNLAGARGPSRNVCRDHLIMDLYTLLAHWCRTGKARTLSDPHLPLVTAEGMRQRLREYPRIPATIAALVTASGVASMDAARMRQHLKDIRRRHPQFVRSLRTRSGGTHHK